MLHIGYKEQNQEEIFSHRQKTESSHWNGERLIVTENPPPLVTLAIYAALYSLFCTAIVEGTSREILVHSVATRFVL
jgi:hypothetical protein